MTELLKLFSQYPQVSKAWGTEIILVNNDQYCAKLLHLTKGWQCSLHRHLKKTETFFVLSGNPIIELRKRDELVPTVCIPGSKVHIKAGTFHRFMSYISDALLLEVSTPHSDDDVERLEDSRSV